MDYTVIKAAAHQVSRWSGGQTTELFLWPKGTSYQSRDFFVRASSATVDLLESDFTPLEGFNRLIMPLDHELRLLHEGGKEVLLHPFDVYSFSGGLKTHSFGKCRDFNLMLKEPWRGELEACAPGRQSCCMGLTGFFILQDGVSIYHDARARPITLDTFDLLLIQQETEVELVFDELLPVCVKFSIMGLLSRL